MLNSLLKRPSNFFLDGFFDDEFFMPRLSYGNHIDVYQEEKNYVVEVDLPGFKKEEINLSFNNDLLTIKAQHKEQSEKKEKKYVYQSRSTSSYMRQIRVGNVDHTTIDASFNDGVLKVMLPKKSEIGSEQVKQIEVK